MQSNTPQIALIGFGEAGTTIAATLGLGKVKVHDIKLTDSDPAVAADMRRRIEAAGLVACDTPADAVAGADIVFCVLIFVYSWRMLQDNTSHRNILFQFPAALPCLLSTSSARR